MDQQAGYTSEMALFVTGIKDTPSRGVLRLYGRSYACALGRGGITRNKREGDSCTPAGTFKLRPALLRPDRPGVFMVPGRFPHQVLKPNDGWSDDPRDPLYNRPVVLPHRRNHERLWREDGAYDVIIPLGYNDVAPQPGRGSAIFFHLANPDYGPTEGCVAVSRSDMRDIWMRLRPGWT